MLKENLKNSKKTISAILLLVFALSTQLPALTMDSSTEGFLHKTDPIRIAYDEFRDQFGRDEIYWLLLKLRMFLFLIF